MLLFLYLPFRNEDDIGVGFKNCEEAFLANSKQLRSWTEIRNADWVEQVRKSTNKLMINDFLFEE